MKYRRLKTLDSTGVPILRYYELEDTVAYANAFYEIADNKATKITGTPTGDLIGFSHGGNNLAKGLIFLDINPTVVYMGILGEEDTDRPDIGAIVNGYQRVIDTHYDGDEDVSGKGLDPDEWGIETMDNPYYLFTIVQPEGTPAADEIDDTEAGEISGVNPYQVAVPQDEGRENDTPGESDDNP